MPYVAIFAVSALSAFAGASLAIRIVCNRALATIQDEVQA